jgi:hypothetical protein
MLPTSVKEDPVFGAFSIAMVGPLRAAANYGRKTLYSFSPSYASPDRERGLDIMNALALCCS